MASTTTAPLSEQFPTIYAEWVAAGGIRDAFRANLLAVQGGLAPAPADVLWMLAHVTNALEQLNLVLAKSGVAAGLQSQVVVVSSPAPLPR